MPIEMTRPKKIPVGQPPSDLSRVEVEAVDDGSFIVMCFHRQPKGEDGTSQMTGYIEPEKYTFSDTAKMLAFVGQKFGGAADADADE